MPDSAALRAAVFPLSTKNLRGADIRPPSVRGLSTVSDLAPENEQSGALPVSDSAALKATLEQSQSK